MGEILLGTSGWSYKDWIGPFYRDDEKSKLSSYSKVFKTVEIDSTFYSYPSEAMVSALARYTRPGFVYSAKLPKLITHKKRLDMSKGVEEDLKEFCRLMRPLLSRGKLGCILVQLPPKFGSNKAAILEDFLKVLPSDFNFAIEFRDPSWLSETTWNLLSKYGVAYTVVDEPLLPPHVVLTSEIAYFRWHGRGVRPWYNYRYSEDELRQWVPKLREAAGKVDRVLGYFNNHFHGYAVENCLQVLEMLGALTQEQAEAKTKIVKYFSRPPEAEAVLSAKLFPSAGSKLSEELLPLMDLGRFKRIKEIDDSEVVLDEVSEDRLRGSVRGYNIDIDLERRVILHDCADWSRCIPEKKLCKHVGKFLLSLDEGLASRVLKRIASERELWAFKPYAE
jgi:uncharacterized protein YecE (DUF72 family)